MLTEVDLAIVTFFAAHSPHIALHHVQVSIESACKQVSGQQSALLSVP